MNRLIEGPDKLRNWCNVISRKVRLRGKDRPASFWPPRTIGLVNLILYSFTLVCFLMAPRQMQDIGLEDFWSDPVKLFFSLIANLFFLFGFCCMCPCYCFFVLIFVLSFLYISSK